MMTSLSRWCGELPRGKRGQIRGKKGTREKGDRSKDPSFLSVLNPTINIDSFAKPLVNSIETFFVYNPREWGQVDNACSVFLLLTG